MPSLLVTYGTANDLFFSEYRAVAGAVIAFAAAIVAAWIAPACDQWLVEVGQRLGLG